MFFLLAIFLRIDFANSIRGYPSLYSIIDPHFTCPEFGPISCSLIEINYSNLRFQRFLNVPEPSMIEYYFKKRRQWQMKGVILRSVL